MTYLAGLRETATYKNTISLVKTFQTIFDWLPGSPVAIFRFLPSFSSFGTCNVAPMNGPKTPRELGLLPRSFDHRTRKAAARERKLFKKRFVTIAFVSNFIFFNGQTVD